jgi:hypothetical protein
MSNHTELETLDTLLRRYSGVEEPPPIPRIKFEEALRQRDDPLHIIPYMAGLGIDVRSVEDLFLLNDDEDEEELYCFRVVEGVVAVMASDDLWLLFETSKP